MAIILDGPVTPDEGTLFVRNIPSPVDGSALDAFLPDIYGPETEFDFSVLSRRGNTARFRAYDGPAHLTPRDNLTINRVPLVPLSGSKPVLTEQELAKLYGLHYLNAPQTAAAEAIYDDLENVALDIRRRALQAKGQVLGSATLPITEGGFNGTIDFGVPAGNKLTAPVLFSNPAADIVGFFNTARAAYIALNGYAPGKALTSTNVVTLMQQNTKLQTAALATYNNGVQSGFPGLIPQAALAAILGAYNFPNPTQYICDARVDVDGVSTLVFPNNVIVLGPPDGTELGRMQWGPTVTAQKLAGDGTLTVGDAPGLVGFVDRGDAFPYRERTIGDSLALPGITNANAYMLLTVA